MRKIITSVVLISSFLMIGNITTSCSKVEDIIDDISVPIPFTIPLSFETTVPFATANTTDYVTYPEIPVNIDVDAKIKEKYPSLSVNNLKSAKLDNFTISAMDGSQIELDAIKDARIYLKTPDLDKILVAEVVGNTNKTNINFTPFANTELINHLKSKQNSFIMEIKGSKITAGSLKIKIDAGFRISVGL